MDKNDILQLFLEESLERLHDLSNQLLELENDSQDVENISALFRSAHTLKGNSTTVYNTILDMDPDEITLPNIDKVGKLTHALENLIMEARDNGLVLNENHVDLLFETEDVLETLISYVEAGQELEIDVEPIYVRLKDSVNDTGEGISKEEKPKAKKEESNSKSNKFEVFLNCDESFRHAFLSLVYRDIEEKFKDAIFEPSFDDLMNGDDFDNIYVTVSEEHAASDIANFIESIDDVENVTILNDNSKQKTEKKQLDNEESKIEVEKEDKIANTEQEESKEQEAEKEQIKEDINTSIKKPTAPKEKSILMNTSIKVAISRIDEVLKHVSNLVILKNKLLNYSSEAQSEEFKVIKDTAEEISQTVEFLQESVMNIRMTPLDHLFGRFPKDVRNIAKEYNKKVNFKHIGGDTEIDKSLLDKLGDPLMHLIRNSVFHGLESPDEREAAGKDINGQLTLSAKHEQSMVVITVEDDGAGIDIEKVAKKAVEKGLISDDKARNTSDKELAHLIFHPGLSTAEKVTNVAGRGVGMDAVKSTIAEDMKGQIEIDTVKGKGTKIIIRLPLTLAIVNAMLTKIAGEVFAFPSSQVESVEEVNVNELRYVANKEIYVLREKEVPIIRLRKFFKLGDPKNEEKTLNVVILKTGNKTIGVTVDDFMGHEDIVLKNMGEYLGNVPGIGGCNVLGNGDISLIVDVNSLVNNI